MSNCQWKLKLDNIFGSECADLQSARFVFISLHAAGLN